ncbi:MAG: FecR domain-containing protein [Gammaproteobacteria bacterium]|nr:FecR domain-containing protein [Gammaproteobacteria bacterium]
MNNTQIQSSLRTFTARAALSGFVLLLSATAMTDALAQSAVGTAEFTRGIATAQRAGSAPRLIGEQAPIYEGDVIRTAERSATVLVMKDGTRIVLRPLSVFQIQTFRDEANNESALMRLFRGGMRAVTGSLSKRNRDAVRLATPVATIGIRGTEFDVRLCDGAECQDDAAKKPSPAGRAGFIRGTVSTRTAGGELRGLAVGEAVYAGDRVVTDSGSLAVLALRDQSRVTLMPNSEFQIKQLDYNPDEPRTGRGVFNLLRGGLRTVTGLLGGRRNAYAMQTPVATIGIRGTGYDLLCQGACEAPGGVQDPNGDGLFASVWQDGPIDFNGENPLYEGQSAFLGNAATPWVSVPGIPLPGDVPLPTETPLPPNVTQPPPPPDAPAGMYVTCNIGNCVVTTDENELSLQAGDASFVGAAGGEVMALDEGPAFLVEDENFQILAAGGSARSLLSDEVSAGGSFECTVAQ